LTRKPAEVHEPGKYSTIQETKKQIKKKDHHKEEETSWEASTWCQKNRCCRGREVTATIEEGEVDRKEKGIQITKTGKDEWDITSS